MARRPQRDFGPDPAGAGEEPARPRVTVRGRGAESRSLAVGKIVCVGRNYAAHAREMGVEPIREPVLFLKPSTALSPPYAPIRLPAFSSEIHHEVELVAVIGRRLRATSEDEALAAIAGYAVGLDLTARDLQAKAKKEGLPWSVAKGFDGAAPLSEAVSAERVGDPGDLALELRVNGETRQASRTSLMLHPLPELIAYASRIFTLEPGDLIFTGTPEGVGPLRPGDLVEASIERVGSVQWRVQLDTR